MKTKEIRWTAGRRFLPFVGEVNTDDVFTLQAADADSYIAQKLAVDNKVVVKSKKKEGD